MPRVLPFFILFFASGTELSFAQLAHRGGEIYAKQCASCHGLKGEGTRDNYPEALFGDKPTIDLAELISATMPEGEPEQCTGEDATAVAEWMQSAFYSPEAQARINPPQRRLSRLTVSQYRNSIADLVESFGRPTSVPDDQRGLTGRYYKSRNFSKKEEVIKRLDAGIDFNFGEGTPDKEKIPDAEKFSIRWEGSIVIEETGWYEFILKTENGGRLFLNDNTTALIDAWVKSGYDTEYRESRFLLSGRMYPVRLEWFTFKEKTASIGLWWKPPHGVDQPVPGRHLSPVSSQPVLVTETPFPPDDRSDGYLRGTAVSPEWDEATTYAAIETVDKLLPQLPALAKLNNDTSEEERRNKLQEFCSTFAYRAFRRPLAEEERKIYVDGQFNADTTTPDAVYRSLLAILKSPRFLYREVTGTDDAFTKASRLSFAIIDSLPDNELLQAASKGQISTDKQLREQAQRLVNSHRGRVQLLEFLRVWLNLDRLQDIGKDAEQFPDFNPQLVADMRTSLELLLDETVNAPSDGFQTLLTSNQTWMNGRLAEFFKIEVPADGAGEFRKVSFEPEHRAGIVSHPFLMTGLAYQHTSSPIHRGVFLSRGILGRALKPPPDSVAPIPPDLEPDLTTRQRVTKQTSPALCANCHIMINALGFALEDFDAVGRYRTTERNQPVDINGEYRLRTGETVRFRGATELAAFLSENPETHRSFTRQLFHHMVQQPILAYGPDTISQLTAVFTDKQFDMQQLMVEIAMRSATHIDSPAKNSLP